MRALRILLALGWIGVCFGSSVAEQAPAEPSESNDYIVGVEDVLGIVVWGETDLSRSVKVRPDGKITIPLVNDVAVAGLRTEMIRGEIAKRLSAFIREPNVTVIVEEINSYRVYFLGEVNLQGAVQFYRPTRLLQGIAAAGGLTEFAKKKITLVRSVESFEKRFEIDYKHLLSGQQSQENILLVSGDVLIFH